MAAEIPVVRTGNIYWDALNDFTEQYSYLMSGRLSLEECLKRTQEASTARLH